MFTYLLIILPSHLSNQNTKLILIKIEPLHKFESSLKSRLGAKTYIDKIYLNEWLISNQLDVLLMLIKSNRMHSFMAIQLLSI
jgi:hypothetical protein